MVDPILIPILAITFTLGVPAIALATHFVLRPLVRDIVGAIKTDKEKERALPADVDARLERLEEAYGRLESNLNHLLEVERFHRELESGNKESDSRQS
jgi:hypothetical protein